jgi:hypothetical protein
VSKITLLCMEACVAAAVAAATLHICRLYQGCTSSILVALWLAVSVGTSALGELQVYFWLHACICCCRLVVVLSTSVSCGGPNHS